MDIRIIQISNGYLVIDGTTSEEDWIYCEDFKSLVAQIKRMHYV